MENSRKNERVRQRASRACDSCRTRKIKCLVSPDTSNCLACTELKLECTNVQPRKKRGPKNRYVQKLRAQLDGESVWDSNEEQHSLNMIAPQEVLHQILEDWFNYIHPVAPIFERSEFEEHITASSNSGRTVATSLLLLVASICAATVASLRRRQHLYGSVTVESCINLAERLKFWSMSSKISVRRSLIAYNLSVAVVHEEGFDSPLAFRLNGEACTCIRYLVDHEFEQITHSEQQVIKRLYWLEFAGQCTRELHGRRAVALHQVHEPFNTLLPETSPPGEIAPTIEATGSSDYKYVPGLIALSRLFLVWQSSQAVRIQTLDNLHEHITRVQQVLDDVPPELTWPAGINGFDDFGFNVQKVNLKVTQLHIRSNLLEQMNTLAKDRKLLVTPDAILRERSLVVDELLDVLYTMPEVVFDANGYSIVSKIRDIGSAILDELRTGSRDQTLHASLNMDRLLAKLEHLDQRIEAQATGS